MQQEINYNISQSITRQRVEQPSNLQVLHTVIDRHYMCVDLVGYVC